jgi:hypothetical protein
MAAIERGEGEFWEAVRVDTILARVRGELAALSRSWHLTVLTALIEDAKQRCVEEGVPWPLDDEEDGR